MTACTAAMAALAASLGLAACQSPQSTTPAFYRPLGSANAIVDAEAARATISAYRLNRSLTRLDLDPGLTAMAQREASAMAAADRPGSADAVKARLAREGVARASVNVSAGYRTLAEAFSGWRESPQHDRTMLDPKGGRMGIASAFAPGSKYQVYWVLVVAE